VNSAERGPDFLGSGIRSNKTSAPALEPMAGASEKEEPSGPQDARAGIRRIASTVGRGRLLASRPRPDGIEIDDERRAGAYSSYGWVDIRDSTGQIAGSR
jgi:hypothetical protein